MGVVVRFAECGAEAMASFEHMMNAYNKGHGRSDSALQRPTLQALLQARARTMTEEEELASSTRYLGSSIAQVSRPSSSVPSYPPPPSSGTIRHWTPPTSLFSGLGLENYGGRPYPPLPS